MKRLLALIASASLAFSSPPVSALAAIEIPSEPSAYALSTASAVDVTLTDAKLYDALVAQNCANLC